MRLPLRSKTDRFSASPFAFPAKRRDDAFGQPFVTQLYAPLNTYHVILEVAPQYQQDVSALSRLRPRRGRQDDSDQSVRCIETGAGHHLGQSSGTIPGGDAVV
jgi:hypothetical protein